MGEDRVFVGEPKNIHSPGRVYIFEQEDDSTWTETTYLEAKDGSVGDSFGTALNGNDDQVLVGAPSSNAAYLFQRGEDGWMQSARLTAADSTAGFGSSVALTDTHLFVSTQATVSVTPADSANASPDTTVGAAVHVFTKNEEAGWTESTVLKDSQLSAGASFGESLIAADDHLLVSAPKQMPERSFRSVTPTPPGQSSRRSRPDSFRTAPDLGRPWNGPGIGFSSAHRGPTMPRGLHTSFRLWSKATHGVKRTDFFPSRACPVSTLGPPWHTTDPTYGSVRPV
jgi:hypothetical protein